MRIVYTVTCSSSIVQVINVLNRTFIVLCRNIYVTDRHSSLCKLVDVKIAWFQFL